MSKIKRFLIALTVLAAASLASAQIGTPPGIGYPPWTSGGTFTGSLAGPVGCTTPPFTFTGDPNTGLCADGADSINLRAGGVSSLNATATTVTAAVPVYHPVGAVGAPSLSFTGDTNTGFYAIAADRVGLSTGGVLRGDFGSDHFAYTSTVVTASGTLAVEENQLDFVLAGATTVTPHLEIADSENIFLEFARVGAPTRRVYFQQGASIPYFDIYADDAPTSSMGRLALAGDAGNAYVYGQSGAYSGQAGVAAAAGQAYLNLTDSGDAVTARVTIDTTVGTEIQATMTGATAGTPALVLADDDTNQEFLTFSEVGSSDQIIFRQHVSDPLLSIRATKGAGANYAEHQYDAATPQMWTDVSDGTTNSTLIQAQNELDWSITAAINATPHLELIDDDNAQNFLTFTDVGTPANVIAFQQDVDGPGWQVATTDGTTTNTLVQNENNFQVDLAGAQQSDIAFALADAPNGSFLTFTDAAGGAGIIDFSRNIDTYTLITAVDTSAGADARTQVEQTNAAFIAQNTSGTSAAADFTFWLADNAGSYDFLTLADSVGDTGSIIFRGATDADAPNLSFIASHTATPHDATFTLDGDNTPSINMNVDTMAIDIGLTEVEIDQNLAVGDAATNDQIRINPVVAGGGAFDVILTTVDVTGADKTVTFADASGTVMLTTVANNGAGNANSVTGGTNQIIFEGTTGADNVQTFLQAVDPTVADGTFYVADLGLAGSQNPTATAVTTAYMAGHAVMAVTIPDTGADANPALLTLEPVPGVNVYLITCSDDDTCDVTVDDGSAQPGMEAVFINIGGQTCDFADQANVLELTAGAALAGGQNNNLSVVYANGAFIETGRASTP